MSSSKELGNKSVPLTSKTQKGHYVLLPKLHPNRWKLVVLDLAGREIFHVIRLPTNIIRYRIQAIPPVNDNPITVKTIKVGTLQYYSLFVTTEEQFSIRFPSSSPIVTLYGKNRKVVAYFKPLHSDIVFLQTDTKRVARIQFKEKPSVLGFAIKSEVEPENHWLYAIILYAIAWIESQFPESYSENESVRPISENAKTATP